jgi:hypothetical protein
MICPLCSMVRQGFFLPMICSSLHCFQLWWLCPTGPHMLILPSTHAGNGVARVKFSPPLLLFVTKCNIGRNMQWHRGCSSVYNMPSLPSVRILPLLICSRTHLPSAISFEHVSGSDRSASNRCLTCPSLPKCIHLLIY